MRNILSKFVDAVKRSQYEVFIGSCVILIALISYNLGQINSLKKTSISVKESTDLKADIFDAANPQPPALEGRGSLNNIERQKLDTRVVVSKNSDKYHYSWCSGAKRIKPENQIWFNSAQEAESKGYVLAGNCSQ
ncbi:MAG TPA: hypothetical protein VJ046_03565 [Candidatus Paceibacterota bacterium]|nr:hypothetical protein [Candidatus Paceibacterota bacterium]